MSLINNSYPGPINPSILVLASAGTQYRDMNQTGTTQTLLATATSASLGVRIQADFSPRAVIGLDNVVLTPVAEPHSYAMLLAGLLAIGLQLQSQAQAPGRQGR